jgi:hypothetical protein
VVGWDIPDIPVDPNTDIGYDSSRLFADIGTKAAFAAATAGVSCGSTLGQALNAAEAIGGAVNVGQAVGDMAQNGLTAGNAAQLGMGVMSIALGTVFKNCFPAGTPVSTERGQKPIEEVQAGDRVWAYSLPTGQWTLRPVMETYEFVNEDFVELRIDGPDGEEDKITSTAGHPFWVISGEDLENRPRPEHITAAEQELRDDKSAIPGRWVDAQDLYPDDVLLLRNGREATIWNVEFYRESQKTYNFAVDDLHCYAVGQLAVLVHNGCGDKTKGGTKAPPSGETPATIRGRQAHKDYNPGPGYDKEVLLDSGKRADAVDWSTNTVRELKPNNPRAIKRGIAQVELYRLELEQMTGEPWTAILDLY